MHTGNTNENLELILLAHQFIPLSFDDLFKKNFPKKKQRHNHLLDFLNYLSSDIRKVTWLAHCDARIERGKSQNITQRLKIAAKPRKRHPRSSTTRRSRTTPSSSLSPVDPTFDPQLWLIWASSNFLHSGSWSEYRSSHLYLNNHINNRQQFISSFNFDSHSHPLMIDSFILFSLSTKRYNNSINEEMAISGHNSSAGVRNYLKVTGKKENFSSVMQRLTEEIFDTNSKIDKGEVQQDEIVLSGFSKASELLKNKIIMGSF
ncbi:hypothetical protein C1645_840490 [Glomus cerebriforme]|uniref:Uncharacterized protein n=1 Tax=Glomus cerebriforme TaxID=658196 RepID=A0A397S484_9GLOM|nr:hypothetical protein C1645_840490 [Glomus cerebriforme]